MGSLRIDELSGFAFTCQARGNTLQANELKYRDRDHHSGEPDRDIASWPFDSVGIDELRCPCGSTVTPVKLEG